VGHRNIEIKARCADPQKVKRILAAKNAIYKGSDHQIDIYFRVNKGRLKLREGDLENFLIYYERADDKGPKESQVLLFPTNRGDGLKEILSDCLGVLATVDKRREIYFIENIKFHIDEVQGLGSFVEIEAKGQYDGSEKDLLTEQCSSYLQLLQIRQEDLLSESYSDLLIR
jgi:adenylate cyclase class 2